jgi:hypothetical protein
MVTAADVRRSLAAAEIIVASDLTLIECDRVILRAAALRELTEAADRRAHLTAAASHWQILRLSPEIVERARKPFPGEPIRTLDTIHLASMLVARTAIMGLTLLSLDDRVRKAGKKLGLDIIPDWRAGAPAASHSECRRRRRWQLQRGRIAHRLKNSGHKVDTAAWCEPK